MTLNDLEWPFYVKFSLSQTALFTYLLQSLFTHMTGRDVRMCGSGPRSAGYLGSAEKLRIFRRRYIVGTLTNKTNISISYYFVPDRLFTDSKTRDLE